MASDWMFDTVAEKDAPIINISVIFFTLKWNITLTMKGENIVCRSIGFMCRVLSAADFLKGEVVL